jgi:hypothetical protein
LAIVGEGALRGRFKLCAGAFWEKFDVAERAVADALIDLRYKVGGVFNTGRRRFDSECFSAPFSFPCEADPNVLALAADFNSGPLPPSTHR